MENGLRSSKPRAGRSGSPEVVGNKDPGTDRRAAAPRTARAMKRSEGSCAEFAERWLEDWPRPLASTGQLYKQAADRFTADFGPTLIWAVERTLDGVGRTPASAKHFKDHWDDVRGRSEHPGAGEPATRIRIFVCRRMRRPLKLLLQRSMSSTGFWARAWLWVSTQLEFRALVTFDARLGPRAGEIQGLQWLTIHADTAPG